DHTRLRLPRQSLPRRLLQRRQRISDDDVGNTMLQRLRIRLRAENCRRAMLDRRRNEAVAVGRLATNRHEQLAWPDLPAIYRRAGKDWRQRAADYDASGRSQQLL